MKKLLLTLLLIPSIGLTEVKVENFTFEREETTDKTYIIVSTDKTANVKCAIFDKNDKPVRVSDGVITPPLGELEVLSRNAMITSVECYEEEATYEELAEALLLEMAEAIQDISSDEAEELGRLYLLELGRLAEEEVNSYYESLDLTEEESARLDELEAERTAQQLAYENEQYNRLLTQEVQSEDDQEKLRVIEDQRNILQSAWLNNISARVKSMWRYQGAEDDWTAEVYVVQDRDGTVVAVDVRNANVDDSSKAKVFKDSIRRAVYKASPLPIAPEESVFDKELIFKFSVN
jgi:colicin import membrane protein